MDKTSKIYVAGHTGMVGSAIVRELDKQGYENIITAEFETRIEAESFLEDYMDKMGWKIKIWEVT